MKTGEIFRQTIKRKMERLEELAEQPSGQRFLHHTVMGVRDNIRSSVPYTILKYGLTFGKEREENPETKVRYDRDFYSDYRGVWVLDDSFESYREGSDTTQMMTLLINPDVMTSEQEFKIFLNRKHRHGTSPYLGEFCIDKAITPDNILGAIVPGEGHNTLYHFQTRSGKDPKELEKEDKERYKSFDGRSKKGTINEIDKDHRIIGTESFYRGLLWGMKDFPQNAFPVFTGFQSSHFPYESGVRNFFTGKVDENNEIPLEFYLAQQIFPLTQEAYMQQVFVDMARKSGVSPREIGLGRRVAKGLITPEQALGREMTPKEKKVYSIVDPKYDEERNKLTAEMAKDNQGTDSWKDLGVYERRKLILGERAK